MNEEIFELENEDLTLEDIHSSIYRVLHEDTDNKHLIPEQAALLGELFADMARIFGEVPVMRLRPNYKMGSVTVEVPEVQLTAEQTKMLAQALSPCNTFEILALTSGGVRVSATIKHMYYDE